MLLLYRFWLTEICICHKPRPTRDETRGLKIAPSTTLIIPFFNSSGTLHARHIRAIFELWGRPFYSSLLVSFFDVAMKGIQFTQIRGHFSFLSFTRPTTCFFYPAVDGRWIHVNFSCSTCIYSNFLVVSLNDEPWLAHRRQQSAGSAFQFYNRLNCLLVCGDSASRTWGWSLYLVQILGVALWSRWRCSIKFSAEPFDSFV